MNGQVFNILHLTSANPKEFVSPFFLNLPCQPSCQALCGTILNRKKIALSPVLDKKTPQWISSPWAISSSFSLISHHMDTELCLIFAVSTQMKSCIGGPEIVEMSGLEFWFSPIYFFLFLSNGKIVVKVVTVDWISLVQALWSSFRSQSLWVNWAN